jgi:hypothetical protein
VPVKLIKREAQGAFDRYVALTGEFPASPDDPAIRRFLAAYECFADRERAAGRSVRRRPQPRGTTR